MASTLMPRVAHPPRVPRAAPPRVVPVVAVLDDARIRYKGRALATQHGGTVVVVAKRDGAVVVHGLDRHTKPLFYNPAGRASWTEKDGRFRLRATSATGESLSVSGRVVRVTRVPAEEAPARRPRAWLAGAERDLVRWVLDHPERLGLRAEDFVAREEHRVGGRVDLLFRECVVEVKKDAGAHVYDQVHRYLRSRGLARGIVVCLHASEGLRDLAARDPRVTIVEVPADEFFASFDRS